MRELRLILLVLALAGAARADSFAGLYEPDYPSDKKITQTNTMPSRPIKHLVYPVMGFPSLVEPAGKISLKILLPNGGTTTDWQAKLVTAASPTPASFPLQTTGVQQFDPATGVYTVEVALPASLPCTTYDLELASKGLTLANVDRQPNAVRVLDPARPNRCFAIIADSQLQDLNTQVPPQRLVAMLAEIKLRAPDFVLFCGDLNFGSDYGTEYEQNWQIFSSSGLAIFYVPGNHDGYATVIAQSSGPNPPGVLERDGLQHWRRYIGPTLFSFDWLGQHFVGINSMGGPPERRNSAGILVTNYGGYVSAPELDWIENDVKDATARGKRTVLFMHHNPSATPGGDQIAYPYPIPTFSWQTWNDAASKARLDSLVANYDVSHVFYGHIHGDSYEEVGSKKTPYVATTTIDCGPANTLGYRWVATVGGAISEIHYMGLSQQSVPYPSIGENFDVSFSGARDGTMTALKATISSKLLLPADVTVELPIQQAPSVRAVGGVLESVAVNGSGVLVARVRGTVPASGQATLGVVPDQTGTATGAATATGPGSASHGVSGCEIAPASPMTGAPLLVLLLVLLARIPCSLRERSYNRNVG